MNKTKNSLKTTAFLVLVSFLLVSPALGQGIPDFLKGKARSIDTAGQKINKSMDSAFKLFKSDYEGKEYYFTGYIFPSRYDIQMGSKFAHSEPYTVNSQRDKIKVRRMSRDYNDRFSVSSSEDQGEPAGILFLHRVKGNRSEIVDVHIFDLDQNFHFENEPVYWLGEKDSQESVHFLKDIFESVSQGSDCDDRAEWRYSWFRYFLPGCASVAMSGSNANGGHRWCGVYSSEGHMVWFGGTLSNYTTVRDFSF